MPECPSDDELRRFGDEALDAARQEEIERHIRDCPRCDERMAFMAWEVDPEFQPPAVPRYEIIEKIGEGAMGVAYLALDAELDRPVVLKVLAAGSEADPSKLRRRWLREAKAIARVSHPNIIQLFDFDEIEGRLYFILQYARGGALSDRLKDQPIPARDAAGLLEQVAITVQHIHDCKLLHLDLKPANILLDGDRHAPWNALIPKVADFGLALPEDPSDTLQSVIDGPRGTPEYMPPEQVIGDRARLGVGADVYSLGVVLYELLTGQRPFRAATRRELYKLVTEQEPVPPRRLNPAIPRELETIALKCLQKDPSHRYSSARDLADDLRRWIEHRPIKARPISPLQHAWRWCRRKPMVAGLLAALVIGALISVQRIREEQESTKKSLALMSSVTAQLAEVLLEQLPATLAVRKRDAPLGKPEQVIMQLTERIMEVDGFRGVTTDVLERLGELNGMIANRLDGSGRFLEARSAARRRVDLLKECLARNPRDQHYLHYLSNSYLELGKLFTNEDFFESSFRLFKESQDIVMKIRDRPLRARCFVDISRCYLQLETASNLGNDNLKNQARLQRSYLLSLTTPDDLKQPDELLFAACTLADDGRYPEAKEYIEQLKKVTVANQADLAFSVIDGTHIGLGHWVVRELDHWDQIHANSRPNAEELEREAAELVDLIDHLSHSLKIQFPLDSRPFSNILNQLATLGTNHRKAGCISGAERLSDLFLRFADKIVRLHPSHAWSYAIRSEALVQISKNGWTKNDLSQVRRGLEQSIKALEEGLRLDESNVILRVKLRDQKERLAALPPIALSGAKD